MKIIDKKVGFISASDLMHRWGLCYIEFRQLPICYYCSYRMDGEKAIKLKKYKHESPFEKSDFKNVLYDFDVVLEYEFYNPELVQKKQGGEHG